MNTRTFRMFAVDTDSYAGNFCREMCAYMTGEVGDCEVGAEEAQAFDDEMGITETEHGPFKRPKSVNSPELVNDIGQEPDEQFMKRPCRIIPNPRRYVDRDAGNWISKRVGDDDPAPENPAKLSFGIIINRELSREQVKILKERAQSYAEKNNIKIDGFREITELTVEFSKSI